MNRPQHVADRPVGRPLSVTPRDLIRVGSKNFTEQILLGEILAQRLEREGFTVERRLNLGGTSDYYVSFDNEKVGELQGQGLVQGIGAKPGAQIIQIEGAPTDNNATLYKNGQLKALQPKYDSGEFAKATGLTTGAITGVIDRLERAGYVRRERDQTDRRKVIVRARPAMTRRIAPLYDSLQREMTAEARGR